MSMCYAPTGMGTHRPGLIAYLVNTSNGKKHGFLFFPVFSALLPVFGCFLCFFLCFSCHWSPYALLPITTCGIFPHVWQLYHTFVL